MKRAELQATIPKMSHTLADRDCRGHRIREHTVSGVETMSREEKSLFLRHASLHLSLDRAR